MAIVQASMTEEILSRSEKAVIRGIYRASQLAETKITLDKIAAVIGANGVADKAYTESLKNQLESIEAYLTNAICKALVTTKVPSINQTVKENSPSQA